MRFVVVARLDQEELRDLEASYHRANSVRRERAMVVDARRPVHVDEPTPVLLDRLKALGATIHEHESTSDERVGSVTEFLRERWRAALARHWNWR